jgi:hypothetical protein
VTSGGPLGVERDREKILSAVPKDDFTASKFIQERYLTSLHGLQR